MTRDPIRRQANNARAYQNRKARSQGQAEQPQEDQEDTGGFWTS
jgi:hypothetical protein